MSSPSKFHFDNVFAETPLPCGDSLVVQLGEMYCSNGTDIPDHVQSCYEFTYALGGRGTVYTDGKAVPIEKNDCVWSIPGDRHRIVSDERDPLRFSYVAYTSKDAEIAGIHAQLFERMRLSPDRRRFTDESLRAVFADMLTEISDERAFVFQLLGSLLKILVIRAFRALTHAEPAGYRLDKKESSYLAYQTARYIDSNLLSINALAGLEGALHYNYQYLARNFGKVMNTTLRRYYLGKRMEKATELLRSGLTVTETAARLEYSCVHAFSRAYQSYYRVPPSHAAL